MQRFETKVSLSNGVKEKKILEFPGNFAEVTNNALYDAFHYFSYPTNTFAKMLDRVFPFHFLWIEFFCDLSCILYSIL
jgi:hypothetical protein